MNNEIIINAEKIEQIGKDLQEIGNQLSRSSSNLKWEMSLSASELKMLKDAKMEYMESILNLDRNAVLSYISTKNAYNSLVKFYEIDIPVYKEMQKYGISPLFIPYDMNLSLEQAVVRYTSHTLEEARAIEALVSRAEEKCDIYVEEIRNQYNGDLGILVGKNISDYEISSSDTFDKKAADEYKKALDKYKSPSLDATVASFGTYLQRMSQENSKSISDDSQAEHAKTK